MCLDKFNVFMIHACNQSALQTKGHTCGLKIRVNEHLRLTNWFADIVLFFKMRPVGDATSDMQYDQYFNKVFVSHGLKLVAMWKKRHTLIYEHIPPVSPKKCQKINHNHKRR